MVLRGFLLMNKCSDKKEEYYVGITAFKAESLIPAMRRRSITQQLNTKANLSESTQGSEYRLILSSNHDQISLFALLNFVLNSWEGAAV